jgi:MFS family permease
MRVTEQNTRWWTLAAMTCSLSMIFIDQTIVSVALPTIQRDVNTSSVEAQWIINAYLLALAALVAAGGRAGDIFGRRRIWIIGTVLFAGFSACAALRTPRAG